MTFADKPDRSRYRSRYRRLRAKKLCVWCGRNRASATSVLCDPCREAHNARQGSRYIERRQRQMCGDCGKPANGSRCTSCSRLRSERPTRSWEYRKRKESWALRERKRKERAGP